MCVCVCVYRYIYIKFNKTSFLYKPIHFVRFLLPTRSKISIKVIYLYLFNFIYFIIILLEAKM